MGAPDISRAGDRGEIEAGKEREIRCHSPPHVNWGPYRAIASTRNRDHVAASEFVATSMRRWAAARGSYCRRQVMPGVRISLIVQPGSAPDMENV
jgi:hypothetical protein